MPKLHTYESFRSTLPEFKVERIFIFAASGRQRSVLRVTCLRTGCEGRFIVNTRWPETRPLGTAPCPWCSRVSIIPGGKFVQ